MKVFNKHWRFIDTGISSANYNMAVDEALFNNFKDNNRPILRLYRWYPSLSFGRFSDADKTIDIKTLHEKNITYVRRMSGGGVLVHGGDLSYSLILPKDYLKGIGIKEGYRHLCQFLIKMYEKIGLVAEFANMLELECSKSSICMASNEPYDIIIDGKKIGGNAQRHSYKKLFQHGSIPISFDASLFEDVFLEDAGLNRIATLDKMFEDITFDKLTKHLKESFEESFEIKLVDDTLSQSEQKSADELLKHKYSQNRWNIDAKYDKT